MRLTIYSKPGCHLCDVMKDVIHRVIDHQADIALEEIDITTDPALIDLYGTDIPVLMIDGDKVAKHRITDQELLRMIRARGKG